MSRGYSVAQTARLVCALRWTCSRLSEILEAWAAQAAAVPEHSDAAADLSQLGDRLASHRARLDGLQPDSELMAPWRQAAPADPSLAEALDGIAALEGQLERLDIARGVLVPELRRVYAEICEHAASHCDGVLIAAARAHGDDLDGDGWGSCNGLDGAPGQGAPAEAEGLLSAAGGIVGPSVLRPSDWPQPHQP